MLENIYRHIEAGLSPLEATLKGAGEIGFTILSISISLVAVFIPLLLMGGIIGRLFREFADHHDDDHRRLGVRRADALADHVRACSCATRSTRSTAKPTWRSSAPSTGCWPATRAAWTSCSTIKRATLAVFLITVAATVVLYIEIPKGFFPQQDTGIIAGLSDAPQDISFDEMVRRQHALLGCRRAGSGRRELRHRARRQPAGQQRLRGHRPQAARSAQRQRRSDHHPPAAAAGEGAGRDAVPAGGAGPQRRRPHHAHAVSVHAAGFGHQRAQRLGAEAARAAAEAADAARRGLGSADQQRHAVPDHRPRPGGALRHSAGRPSIRRSTMPSASARRRSSSPRRTATTWCSRSPRRCRPIPPRSQKLYLKSPLTGQMVPLSAMTKYDTQHVTYLSINHQGQFPGGDAVVQSRAGRGARRCRRCDQPRIGRSMRLPATITGNFQGTAQAFQSSLKSAAVSDSGGAGGRVHHSRHALRELHSSADDSLHAAVGRRGRAADAAAYFTSICR